MRPQSRRSFVQRLLVAGAVPNVWPAIVRAAAPGQVEVRETDDLVEVETDLLKASIRRKGYVSGIAAGTLVDKTTGARDVGFGLHIMDFLMAPGWRDDGYERNPKLHGDLPKHYVEGPQVCTRARTLPITVSRGDGFVAVQMSFTFTDPGKGYKAGSTWTQTLLFQPGVRHVLSAERIISVNDVEDLFYRIDMPGHVRHKGGDTFEQVYLSYLPRLIPAAEFAADFGPDQKFLYRRDDNQVPKRFIRAYQVKHNGKPGPWLAGMTLDPAAVAEAWCHQRGYICFIQELHRRNTRGGETFGAAYVVGWFDDVAQMNEVYDRHAGATAIELSGGKLRLQSRKPPAE